MQGILHDAKWMKQSESHRIVMNGILSGLKEFTSHVKVSHITLDTNGVTCSPESSDHGQVYKKMKQQEIYDKINNQHDKQVKVNAIVIAIDDVNITSNNNLTHICQQVITCNNYTSPHLLLDVTNISPDFGQRLSRALNIPLISGQMNAMFSNDFTTNMSSASGDISPVMWIKQPSYLLAEVTRDLINTMQMTKKPLNIIYTREYCE